MAGPENTTGLKPIEFILPNRILSLTEWHTQMPQEPEVTFSMEHLYLLTNYVLNFLFPPGFPNALISTNLIDNPVETLQENQFEVSFLHVWGVVEF